MTLRILHPRDFITARWKNGGGITHEVARQEDEGGLLWRLSIAEVAADGPFSRFEGMARILTVVRGRGLHLVFEDGTVEAMPRVPVAFPGDRPVTGRLTDGPVQDCNLIYDPARIGAAAGLVAAAGPAPKPPAFCAWLALGGACTADDMPLPAGSVALGMGGALVPGAGAALLRIELRTL